jgi:hypothetical protein
MKVNKYTGIRRTCTMCGKEKNIVQFNRISVDERRHECRKCVGIEGFDWLAEERQQQNKNKCKARRERKKSVQENLEQRIGKELAAEQRRRKLEREAEIQKSIINLRINLPLEELKFEPTEKRYY